MKNFYEKYLVVLSFKGACNECNSTKASNTRFKMNLRKVQQREQVFYLRFEAATEVRVHLS